MCGPQLTERRLYSLHSRAGHARPLLSNKRKKRDVTFAGIPFLYFFSQLRQFLPHRQAVQSADNVALL